MGLRVGSLFAGIGGIDIAFQQANYEVAWAIEKDAACCRTYRHNFPSVHLINDDIYNVRPETLSPVDGLLAGFPCQAFSIAGKQRGFEDARGNLFYAIVKFIQVHQPRFVFLENVPNLVEHDEGKTFLVIYKTLVDLGYVVRYQVLLASEYGGLPQIRNRIYIEAFKDINDSDAFIVPEPIRLTCTIEDILRRNERKHRVYYYADDSLFARKANAIVKAKDAIYRVYHDSIKITRNKMCPTLTASMGTQQNQVPLLCDAYGVRKLTVQECLDFQGFPKGFSIPRTNTIEDAYKQIGNSVCVPVANRIAERIKIVMIDFERSYYEV